MKARENNSDLEKVGVVPGTVYWGYISGDLKEGFQFSTIGYVSFSNVTVYPLLISEKNFEDVTFLILFLNTKISENEGYLDTMENNDFCLIIKLSSNHP